MSALRVARWVSQLPPGSAIYRGEDIDSKLLSQESWLLQLLYNVQFELKDRMPLPSQILEKEQKELTRKQLAEQRFRLRQQKKR